MKAVLAQIAPALGDPELNLRRHLEQARRAARAGAVLIVFPELSLTGYLLQDLASDVAQDARAGAQTARLAAASRRTAIVAGFAELAPGALVHNAAGVWAKGALAHLHRKVYLPTYGMFDEARYFAAGEVLRTFQAPWGRTGLLICEDFWHLSSSYLLSQEGMEVLIVVSASPVKGLRASGGPAGAVWLSLGRVVAQFFGCYVLYVNRAGCEDGWTYSGGSFALDPSGEVLAQARELGPDQVTVRLDPSRIRQVRSAYPLLRDEKLDLVRRELDRIASARYAGS
ncbi:MAG TPA: nitrilase-related carbon-nitrogen hydrolase [Candidatus Polarisedimenticolia bacterium]|nr:nitrilase-related carbon-nitrogen hydrolase [Candidatus Polarisedimenticolia bacterium]